MYVRTYVCMYVLWYGMVLDGMVWYGMVWCGVVWYGMVCMYLCIYVFMGVYGSKCMYIYI